MSFLTFNKSPTEKNFTLAFPRLKRRVSVLTAFFILSEAFERAASRSNLVGSLEFEDILAISNNLPCFRSGLDLDVLKSAGINTGWSIGRPLVLPPGLCYELSSLERKYIIVYN